MLTFAFAMPSRPTKSNLTLDERIAVVAALSSLLRNGVLQRGALSNTARLFGRHRHTIERVWSRRRQSGNASIDLSSRMKGVVGRHPKRSVEEALAAIERVPINKRSTLRTLALAAKLPKTTVVRLLKSGVVRKCNSRVKPALTPANKEERRKFVLSMVNPVTMRFDCMYDRVFVDEKWFYLTQVKKRFYLTVNEDDIQRAVKSKHYIPKIMFIAAVGRPRYDAARARYVLLANPQMFFLLCYF